MVIIYGGDKKLSKRYLDKLTSNLGKLKDNLRLPFEYSNYKKYCNARFLKIHKISFNSPFLRVVLHSVCINFRVL
jgi:hypothetical protein